MVAELTNSSLNPTLSPINPVDGIIIIPLDVKIVTSNKRFDVYKLFDTIGNRKYG